MSPTPSGKDPSATDPAKQFLQYPARAGAEGGVGDGGDPRNHRQRLLPAGPASLLGMPGSATPAGGGGGGPEGRAPSPGRWTRAYFDAGCSPLLQVLG